MAASVFSFNRKDNRVAVMRSPRGETTYVGEKAFANKDLNPTLARFNNFWELMETVKKHGYLRAAMSVVGRSAVGAWWTLVRHEEYGKGASDMHRRRLYSFYTMRTRSWDNIKDYHSIAYKLLIAVQYLRYFGQTAFQILRDDAGKAIGLDHLPGLVVPNVDANGFFKDPAFIQYPSNNIAEKVEFSNPRDVVYIINPDWEGSPMGGTEIEALTEWTLPLDIYLQTAAREYMKNRNRPEVVFSLPPDISDEAFDNFVTEVEARWSGPTNVGRNPIAVQGEFKVVELGKLPDQLPYQESRKEAREEEMAVAGVSGAKLGLSESMSSANIREMRREFHETSLVPLFRLLEQAFYEQIHVREFGFIGWEFKFKSPDFLNAVERATVHLRYQQMGALNANEIRRDLGLPKRTDPEGDLYAGQSTGGDETAPEAPNPQGNPPEGRPVEPDAPAQTGEPNTDNQDPERGDQHDDEVRNQLIAELYTWRNFARKRFKAGKNLREFRSDVLPTEARLIIQAQLSQVKSLEELGLVFDEAIQDVKEVFDAKI